MRFETYILFYRLYGYSCVGGGAIHMFGGNIRTARVKRRGEFGDAHGSCSYRWGYNPVRIFRAGKEVGWLFSQEGRIAAGD